MPINIAELFTPKAIAAYWNETASNREPYLGASLFPARKKAGLDLSWLKGSKGLAVSLMPSAFDAKATFRDRPGLTKTKTEMPFFREGMHIGERDRQELLRVQESTDPYAQAVIDRLFDDAGTLLDGALVVPERMRMALLFANDGDAGITFNANGVSYVYDYDPNDVWKTNNYSALASDYWTDPASSDPLNDLSTLANDIAENTGTAPGVAIMNKYTFGLMAQSAAIKARFLTTNGSTVGYLSDADVKKLISDLLGLRVVVYNKKYKDESGVAAKFVPDGYVSLIPDGPVGGTWFGTTPEEADLLGKVSTAKVSIVETGIAIMQEITNHPVNVNTFASEIVLPSWERMDDCGLLKVIA